MDLPSLQLRYGRSCHPTGSSPGLRSDRCSFGDVKAARTSGTLGSGGEPPSHSGPPQCRAGPEFRSAMQKKKCPRALFHQHEFRSILSRWFFSVLFSLVSSSSSSSSNSTTNHRRKTGRASWSRRKIGGLAALFLMGWWEPAGLVTFSRGRYVFGVSAAAVEDFMSQSASTAESVVESRPSQPLQQQQPPPPVVLHLSDEFPSLQDTFEMALLSSLVYNFLNEKDPQQVCDRIHQHNYTMTRAGRRRTYQDLEDDDEDDWNPEWVDLGENKDDDYELPPEVWKDKDWVCHYYEHDWQLRGTQVLMISSVRRQYLAVVFAGTDDLQTALTDADIWLKPYGDGGNFTLPNVSTAEADKVRIHAGFDQALFANQIFAHVWDHVQALLQNRTFRQQHRHLRLLTTGHSLGASDAVLTAIGLSLQMQKQQHDYEQRNQLDSSLSSSSHRVNDELTASRPRRHMNLRHIKKAPRTNSTASLTKPWWSSSWPVPTITSINFGCPRIGNSYWRDFVHNTSLFQAGSSPHPQPPAPVGLWRLVLGWDLVPRLPEFLFHVGHTIQLYHEAHPNPHEFFTATRVPSRDHPDDAGRVLVADDDDSHSPSHDDLSNATAYAYYQHYGRADLGWAGVPRGWASKPFIWVPGALASHHIDRYAHFLYEWQQLEATTTKPWVNSFVPLAAYPPPNHHLGHDDDDDDHVKSAS